VLRLPPTPGARLLDALGLGGGAGGAPPLRYEAGSEKRSLEWILHPPATVCEDPCAGLSLRKLTASDAAGSPLARQLISAAESAEGPISWTWAGFGGFKFEAGGKLTTPWGGGIWGAPPEAQDAKGPALLAEFAGMKHLLRARVSAGAVRGMQSTRCSDNDRSIVGLFDETRPPRIG